eukprot:5987063-Pyramimonas_sp.AAC.1
MLLDAWWWLGYTCQCLLAREEAVKRVLDHRVRDTVILAMVIIVIVVVVAVAVITARRPYTALDAT